jgi:hypothetical protein
LPFFGAAPSAASGAGAGAAAMNNPSKVADRHWHHAWAQIVGSRFIIKNAGGRRCLDKARKDGCIGGCVRRSLGFCSLPARGSLGERPPGFGPAAERLGAFRCSAPGVRPGWRVTFICWPK